MTKDFLIYIGHDEIKPIIPHKPITMNYIKRLLNNDNIDVNVKLFKNKLKHPVNLFIGLDDTNREQKPVTIQFTDLTYVRGDCILCNWNTTVGEGTWLSGLSADGAYWATEQVAYYDKNGNYKGRAYICDKIAGQLSLLS
ncbi:MAG: hypothetical protein HC907_11485 [Richelia sp. SM1_7_0]|nr:hypothetical protein [Richelia sp. SM1_7_0]